MSLLKLASLWQAIMKLAPPVACNPKAGTPSGMQSKAGTPGGMQSQSWNPLWHAACTGNMFSSKHFLQQHVAPVVAHSIYTMPRYCNSQVAARLFARNYTCQNTVVTVKATRLKPLSKHGPWSRAAVLFTLPDSIMACHAFTAT